MMPKAAVCLRACRARDSRFDGRFYVGVLTREAEAWRPWRPYLAGGANGRNPIAIVIPCHRVIGHDGRLTGYGGGMARKRALLELEAR